MARILVTGATGFIGFHVCRKLAEKHTIVGVDCYDDYCNDYGMKQARGFALITSQEHENITLVNDFAHNVFNRIEDKQFDLVIHLAARGGIGASIEDPAMTYHRNVVETQLFIDACLEHDVDKILYASTSSVYPNRERTTAAAAMNELEITEPIKHPYGLSKMLNEKQFAISPFNVAIGMRFFTVYGDWNRPDMAIFKLAEAMRKGEAFYVYAYDGWNRTVRRDWTHVSDIVDGIDLLADYAMKKDKVKDIFNISSGKPIDVAGFCNEMWRQYRVHRRAGPVEGRLVQHMLPFHETTETWGDNNKLKALGFEPKMPIEQGIYEFLEWYIAFMDSRQQLEKEYELG